MRRTAALLACLALPAQAQDALQVAPVFSQIVAFPLPEGFAPVLEDANEAGYLNESVLAGESVQDWTQMVTLSGSKGLVSGDPANDAATMAAYLGKLYSDACPEGYAESSFDPPQIVGARAVHAGYLSCASLPDHPQSESMVFLVLVGAGDIYTLQWAEHAAASATPIPYAPQVWDGRLTLLAATARLCDPVAGEEPPYPSCIGT